MADNQASIQIQDASRSWRHVGYVTNHPLVIRTTLEQTTKMHKTNSRATVNGQLVDSEQHQG